MGTLINMASILAGSLLGLLLRSRLPDKYVDILFQVLGLFTMFLGVKLALQTEHVLVMILSLTIGAVIGEALGLDEQVNALGNWLRQRLGGQSEGFSEGLVTAFLLFGIGPMATLGALQDGLGQGLDLLMTKSLLDGITSIALSAAFGVGVALSIVAVGVYQGSMTIFAYWIEPWLSEAMIAELSAVGGIMLIGLGLNLLKVTQLRIMNLLPALFLAIGLVGLLVH